VVWSDVDFHNTFAETYQQSGTLTVSLDFSAIDPTDDYKYFSGLFSVDSIAGPENPVPVPATMLLLGSGLAGLAAFRNRFRKA
jgi:hypothetical protein